MSESRRKRKGAPPKRLDTAAREEINFEVTKDDKEKEAHNLLPPPTEDEDGVRANDTEKRANEEGEVVEESISLLDFLTKRANKEDTVELDAPPRERKKQRQAAPPSYVIPFNVAKDSSPTHYVEIMGLTQNCERYNEKFYSAINTGMISRSNHFLYFII
jgi:hypothetical protein